MFCFEHHRRLGALALRVTFPDLVPAGAGWRGLAGRISIV